MELRLELFVRDIESSRDFYTRVLGFEIEMQEPRGYTRLKRDEAAIALNPIARIPKSHPSLPSAGEKTGLGYEISITVEGIEEYFETVLAAGGAIAEPLKSRPWGSQDFCIKDPDGNYIRITT